MGLELEVSFLECLQEENVFFLKDKSKEEALRTMVSGLLQNGYLMDQAEFFDALMQREAVISTGIGMGIAIPHAKVKSVEDFFVAIGVFQDEGIDWGSIDALNVRLIFMIGGPMRSPREYLTILSSLTTRLKEEKVRTDLFRAKNREDVVNIFETC